MAAESIFDLRRLLASPAIYQTFRRLVAQKNLNERLASEFLKIKPGQRVLDVGCGPAELRDFLPDDIDYHGFDINPAYIASAKARYGGRGSFTVRAVSPEAMEEIGKFDVVMVLAVLHHLDDREADTVFASAAQVLRPGGRIVTFDGAYVDGQKRMARMLLALDRGRYVRTPEGYLALARRHFVQASATVLHDLMVVPYTHCIIEARSPS